MHFVVTARDGPHGAALRAETRPRHLAHLDEHGDSVVAAGALLDDDGNPKGSLFIFRAEERAEIEAIMDADPYTQAGVFASIEIEPWRWVINKPDTEA